MPASTKRARRNSILEPYLVPLRAFFEATRTDEGALPPEFRFGDARVTLDSWVFSQIRPRKGGITPSIELGDLLLQGLAILLKCEVDAGLLTGAPKTRGDEATQDRMEAELMLDTALATALLREVQQTVDALIRAGKSLESRRLTAFAHRLHGCVRRAKRTIDEHERERVATLADDLTDVPTPDEAPLPKRADPALEQVFRQYVEAERRKRTRRRLGLGVALSLPSRTTVLTVLVLVALGGWLAGVLPGRMMSHRNPTVHRYDLPSAAPIVELVARYPSLFIVVDERDWSELDEASRLSLVNRVGNGLLVRGYRGALIRTSAGLPVAQWLVTQGGGLLDPAAETALPADGGALFTAAPRAAAQAATREPDARR